MTLPSRSFASDNNAVVHPAVMEAIAAANSGHARGYGDDAWSKKAEKLFEQHFGADCEVAFTFNGTGANIVALALGLRSFNAVICPKFAHINVDECAGPETFIGAKLIAIDSLDGKLTVDAIAKCLGGRGDQHNAQVRMISISQSNEVGLVYTPDEVRALTSYAHEKGLYVHMDGARLSNAAAALGLSLRGASRDLGVDVLSYGGTKNGMMYGEAIVVFNRELFGTIKFLRKQAGQLASKMRFIAAQFIALLEGDLWLKNASHANEMAVLLATEAARRGVQISRKTEANAVFARLPREQIEQLQREFYFYVWDAQQNEVRWMASFDTEESDVQRFIAELQRTSP